MACRRPRDAVLPSGLSSAGSVAASANKTGALPGYVAAGGGRPGVLPDALQRPAAVVRRWSLSADRSDGNNRGVCGGVDLAEALTPRFYAIQLCLIFRAAREKSNIKKKSTAQVIFASITF